ncbi:MAG: glycosyltransferase family 4 protein [Methylomonas sp.]|jgi:glycosyltransferase involved in cell wall biosynthesis
MSKIIIASIMRPIGENGVQTHVASFMRYLSEQGASMQLITPFNYYSALVYPVFAIRRILHPLSGEMSVWWYRFWHALFLQLALREQLAAGADCVIYAQCPVAAAAALRARTSPRQRVVMVTHFNISQADEWAGKGLVKQDGRFFRAIREFEAATLPALDGLVFVSDFMRRELLSRIPAVAQVKSLIAPNFLPDPGEPETKELHADLICIGSLEARKNQKYLLEIMAALRDQGSDLTLTLIGDGADRAMLEETAAALRLTDRVTFRGFMPDGASQIVYHRACIHVASLENLPVTLLEALARGRPLFACPVGGIPEVLAGGDVGLALPLDDAWAAAKLVADAMQDAAWLKAAGQAARRRFINEYDSKVVAARLLQFLLALND